MEYFVFRWQIMLTFLTMCEYDMQRVQCAYDDIVIDFRNQEIKFPLTEREMKELFHSYHGWFLLRQLE